MSSYAQLLEKAADELENAGVEDAHLNARELLGKALGCGCRSFDFEMKLKECAEKNNLTITETVRKGVTEMLDSKS